MHTRCTISSTVSLFRVIICATYRPGQVHLSATNDELVLLIMDYVDNFFALYPTFPYDRTASSPQEFRRMCRQFGWKKQSDDTYPVEQEMAWKSFRIAMVRTFNEAFGEDANAKRSWMHLCTILDIEPAPTKIAKMRSVSQEVIGTMVLR